MVSSHTTPRSEEDEVEESYFTVCRKLAVNVYVWVCSL